jgi:hypothetical protein
VEAFAIRGRLSEVAKADGLHTATDEKMPGDAHLRKNQYDSMQILSMTLGARV